MRKLIGTFIVFYLSLFVAINTYDHFTNEIFGGDWFLIKDPIARGIVYGEGMFNPPWTAVMLYPVAILPYYIGQGIIGGLSLLIFFLVLYQIDAKARFWIPAVLVSMPVVRLVGEGNIEILTVSGIYLLYRVIVDRDERAWLFAVSLILASAKLQETLLIIVACSLYLLFQRRRRTLFLGIAYAAVPIGLSMLWKGQAWIAGLPLDYELYSLKGLVYGTPYYVLVVLIGLAALLLVDYETEDPLPYFGLLASSSILISPYAGFESLIPTIIFGSYYQLRYRSKTIGMLSILSMYLAYVFLLEGSMINGYVRVILILHVGVFMTSAFLDVYRKRQVPLYERARTLFRPELATEAYQH